MVLLYYLNKFKQYISSFLFYYTPFSYDEIIFIKSKPILYRTYNDLKILDMYKKLNIIFSQCNTNTPIDHIINTINNEILCYTLGFKINEKNIQINSVLKKIELEKLKNDFLSLKNLKEECQKYKKVYEIVY